MSKLHSYSSPDATTRSELGGVGLGNKYYQPFEIQHSCIMFGYTEYLFIVSV